MVDVAFLTPRDGLVALAGIVPLAALVLGRRRTARVRRQLALPAGRSRWDILAALAIAVFAVLLGVAAAQPVLDHKSKRLVRRDAEALYVIDVSRSMAASASRGAPTRLQQARRGALAVRTMLADVPAGVASMTDRVLPLLFGSDDERVFSAVVSRSLRVDSPRPRDANFVATTFNALRGVSQSNYFAPGARHRVVILLTDAESRPFDAAGVAGALRRSPPIGLVVWPVGSTRDRFWSADGTPEPGFRPLRSAPSALRALASGGAQVVHSASAAASAAKDILGSGPETRAGTATGRTELAPYAVAAALVPLAGLLALRGRR